MATYLHFFEIEAVETGKTYSPLPLHCTLMGWFSSSKSRIELERITREVCSRHSPFELVSNEPAMFGPKFDLPVYVLQPNTTFMALHLELLAELEHIGAQQVQPSYAGPNYRAHVTTTRNRSFPTGSRTQALQVVFAEIDTSQAPAMYWIQSIIPLG